MKIEPDLRSCSRCEYQGKPPVGCRFPHPQFGGAPLFMVQAVTPEPADDGHKCLQFRERVGGDDD